MDVLAPNYGTGVGWAKWKKALYAFYTLGLKKCLFRSGDGLYNIGTGESAARRMMEEAGKYEIEGAAAAKRRLEKQKSRDHWNI